MYLEPIMKELEELRAQYEKSKDPALLERIKQLREELLDELNYRR